MTGRRLVSGRRLLFIALLLPVACGDGGTSTPDSGEVAGEGSTGVGGDAWFVEAAVERGIDFTWISGHEERHYFPEIMGGGAALFDMDRDGDLDAYLVQAGGVLVPRSERPSNRLFANDGAGSFADVTEASGAGDRGFGMGVAVGDFTDDGSPDLYVTNLEENALLRNAGDGRFEDVTLAAGASEPEWSTSAAFLDYDRDGRLDLFVTNYIYWQPGDELTCFSKPHPEDYCSPLSYNAPAPDTLFRNLGDGSFENVSAAAGLRTTFGNGLGVVCSDFDQDGFEDVFVANDGVKNQLWHNLGDGTFEDAAIDMGCAADQDGREKAGMGTAAADFDEDGDEDLLVVNLAGETDSYFRNDGAHFSDRTPLVGLSAVSRPFTRFGMGFLDFDDDGVLDLYQANGRVVRAPDSSGPHPFAELNLLFRGEAREGSAARFREVEPRGGTTSPLVATSRAAAFGDVDGDGGLDVLVVNRDTPAHLLLNRVPERGNWIAFRVLETSGRDALGARVSVTVAGRTLLRTVRSAYSYCSANSPRVHVGLGAAGRVDGVTVRWVDGFEESFGGFEAGRVVELARGAGQ